MPSGLRGARIAVVGAGLIGVGWAALFLHHGADVALWDPDGAARETARTRMAKPLADLRDLDDSLDDSTCRPGALVVCDDLGTAVSDAVLIQENAPESIPLKHDLFREIEAHARPSALLASSTSAFTWTDLAPALKDPRRLVTAHPFNPPHLVPLVEIYGPDDTRVSHAETLYRAAGRVPVRLRKDAPGHIANRLASALWREAVHIVADGIADVEAVDAALVNGPGFRWSVLGVHMGYHLGGGSGGLSAYLDHLGPSQQRRWSSLGHPSLTPEVCKALIEGVAQEAAGRDILALEAARDTALIAALKARKGTPVV
ncbi:MAG: 3-hydroxyacyl-CoA dehydrogenase [Rhodobacteraceae bacterium CG17_big_fil_post_rev_8_21_14_2_50_63_15]|nr:MAG: 3-hydroxyacyl-CoA dehydrogenase [Rhodobacteraceae bacterium CG17_big_fil_post_rev_8_21_14_2_50_63_15]